MNTKRRKTQTLVRTTDLPPTVEVTPGFIVVAQHTKEWWHGPYETKEQAQHEAMKLLLERNWQSVSVFELVGVITRPPPQLTWHDSK